MQLVNHPAPLAVSAPARVTVNLAGHTSAVVPFTVRDQGTEPVQLTLSAGTFTLREQQYPGASWVTSISPATFRLAPGHSRTVKLVVTVPPGAQGVHYAGLEVLASPAQHGNQSHVGGAIASALVLQRPGYVAPVAPPPHPASPWITPTLLGVTGVAVLAAALAAASGIRWRRLKRRRASWPQAQARHRVGSR